MPATSSRPSEWEPAPRSRARYPWLQNRKELAPFLDCWLQLIVQNQKGSCPSPLQLRRRSGVRDHIPAEERVDSPRKEAALFVRLDHGYSGASVSLFFLLFEGDTELLVTSHDSGEETT